MPNIDEQAWQLLMARLDAQDQALQRLLEQPVRLERLTGRVMSLERDVSALQAAGVRTADWRSVSLPTMLLTLALVLLGAGGLIAQIIHG